jgi:hypothetical protein
MTRLVAFTISTGKPGLSEEIDLQDYKDFAVEMSSSWTASDLSIVAAGVTDFTGSTEQYKPLYHSTGIQTLAVTEGGIHTLSTMGLEAVRFVRFQSTEAQDSERSLKLICK